MVWVGITLAGCTHLHVFVTGAGTSVRYRGAIFLLYVRLFKAAVGSDFVLMDDNARPHRANSVDEFLESEDIAGCGVQPDLHPIEKVWAIAIHNHSHSTSKARK
ncbi:DDE_3 domain-containing protein [Trichonephila clavipes]|nr:DDE_3 domain-containing protein [Trichonephila clavipes]